MRTSTLSWASVVIVVSIVAMIRGMGMVVDLRSVVIILFLALAASLTIGALAPRREHNADELSAPAAHRPAPAEL